MAAGGGSSLGGSSPPVVGVGAGHGSPAVSRDGTEGDVEGQVAKRRRTAEDVPMAGDVPGAAQPTEDGFPPTDAAEQTERTVGGRPGDAGELTRTADAAKDEGEAAAREHVRAVLHQELEQGRLRGGGAAAAACAPSPRPPGPLAAWDEGVVRAIVREELRAMALVQQVAATSATAAAAGETFQLRFVKPLTEKTLYTPHNEHSRLLDRDGGPLQVIATDADGFPSPLLEGLILQCVLLAPQQVTPGSGKGGPIPSIPINTAVTWVEVRPRNAKTATVLGGLDDVIQIAGGKALLPKSLKVLDNSSWVHGQHFVLEVRAAATTSTSMAFTVLPAQTRPFRVKSSRARDNEKKSGSDILLDDPVYRLRNISKGGDFYKRLSKQNVNTVRDLWNMMTRHGQRVIRSIIGAGMSDFMWTETTQHINHAIQNTNASEPNASAAPVVVGIPQPREAGGASDPFGARTPRIDAEGPRTAATVQLPTPRDASGPSTRVPPARATTEPVPNNAALMGAGAFLSPPSRMLSTLALTDSDFYRMMNDLGTPTPSTGRVVDEH